jgi:hypothetical protein
LPAKESADVSNDAVIAAAKEIARFTPQELRAYRQEVVTAPPTDPHLWFDREALALFDAEVASSGVRP